MSSIPSEGDILTGVFGIGDSPVLFPDEKPLPDDDILVQTLEVVSSDGWPISGTVTKDEPRGMDITQDQYYPTEQGVNGLYINGKMDMFCFPYELTEANRFVSKNMNYTEVTKSLSIGDTVFLVEDLELRKCTHPSDKLDRIETSQATRLGLRILPFGANASLSGEKAYYCKKCKSVIDTDEDSGWLF